MLTTNDAIKKLARMRKSQESIGCALKAASSWARYAQEALDQGDVQCAKGCLAVVEDSSRVIPVRADQRRERRNADETAKEKTK